MANLEAIITLTFKEAAATTLFDFFFFQNSYKKLFCTSTFVPYDMVLKFFKYIFTAAVIILLHLKNFY